MPINKEKLVEIFGKMSQLHVVVVGDVMLDNYWWGDVERISPEAPVPIVALKKRESRLGGAANVALNCRTLGAKVTLASVIGNDKEGETLSELVIKEGISAELLFQSKERATTTKTRVISRNQQMMRLDDEVCDELTTSEEHPFIDKILKHLQIEKPDVVIFEDYNKGVLKDNVIRRVSEHCKHLNIITAVDPKNKNFFSYEGVTVFKPNLKEVEEGLKVNLPKITQEVLDKVDSSLREKLHHKISFITLSEKGVYYSNGKSSIIPSHLRNIADVSGAGDTVIATAAMVYAIANDPEIMAEIANIAGGLVCEEVGVVPISKEKLLQECVTLLAQ